MKALLATALLSNLSQGITLVQGTPVFPPPQRTYTIETTVSSSDECEKRGGEWQDNTKTCVERKKQESGN